MPWYIIHRKCAHNVFKIFDHVWKSAVIYIVFWNCIQIDINTVRFLNGNVMLVYLLPATVSCVDSDPTIYFSKSYAEQAEREICASFPLLIVWPIVAVWSVPKELKLDRVVCKGERKEGRETETIFLTALSPSFSNLVIQKIVFLIIRNLTKVKDDCASYDSLQRVLQEWWLPSLKTSYWISSFDCKSWFEFERF